MARNATDSISDALRASVLAGLGAVFIEATLGGSFYFFDPVAKKAIANNAFYILVSVPLVFIAGFGISLASMLKTEFWRGKWK